MVYLITAKIDDRFYWRGFSKHIPSLEFFNLLFGKCVNIVEVKGIHYKTLKAIYKLEKALNYPEGQFYVIGGKQA